jgi:hypothetical protein
MDGDPDQRRQDEADPERHQRQVRQEQRHVRRLGGRGQDEAHGPGRIGEPADREQRAVSTLRGDPPRRDRERDHEQRPRRHREAGGLDRVVPHPGQEQHQPEEHRRERDREDQGRPGRDPVVAIVEQPEVDHGCAGTRRRRDQQAQRDGAGDQHARSERARRPPRSGLYDAQREQRRRGDREDHAGRIGQRREDRGARLDEPARAPRDHEDADGQVEIERPRPAERLDDPRAERRADRRGERADRAPDAHRDRVPIARDRREDEGVRLPRPRDLLPGRRGWWRRGSAGARPRLPHRVVGLASAVGAAVRQVLARDRRRHDRVRLLGQAARLPVFDSRSGRPPRAAAAPARGPALSRPRARHRRRGRPGTHGPPPRPPASGLAGAPLGVPAQRRDVSRDLPSTADPAPAREPDRRAGRRGHARAAVSAQLPPDLRPAHATDAGRTRSGA